MEFRYRAGERPAQPWRPPSLPPLVICPRPSREALQRELQEERLKEEILIRRLNQRRMMEEEVRREMAMERALRFHPVLDPRPLMVLPPPPPPPAFVPLARDEIDFDSRSSSVALQEEEVAETETMEDTPPPKARKQKKRKAAEAAATTEFASRGKVPRKDRKEYSCALCQVSATSEEGLKNHLKGKKHMAKVAKLAPGKKEDKIKINNPDAVAVAVEAKAKEEEEMNKFPVTVAAKEEKIGMPVAVPDTAAEGEAKVEERAAAGDGKKKKILRIMIDGISHWVEEKKNHLYCEVCDVSCCNLDAMIIHLSGKKHSQEEEEDSRKN